MKYLAPLPIASAALLLAFFSFARLGQTYFLSALFGAHYLGSAAEGAFFFLTVFYALALLLMRRFFNRRFFNSILWAINLVLAVFLAAALLR